MRSSRDERQHLLLFACGIVVILGCTNYVSLRGALAPMATELIGGRVSCPATQPHSELGMLRGCIREARDTTFYYYRTSSGEVVTVGTFLRGNSATVISVFDSLVRSATRHHGAPSLACDRTSDAWIIRDVRWQTDGHHNAVLMATPTAGVRARPFVHHVSQVGVADCSLQYSVPRAR
jgi:hypothetical protein